MSENKVESVFITGISSGIGLGLTKLYLERGAQVYGLSRREPPKLSDERRLTFRSIDLRDPLAIETGLKSLLPRGIKLDLVVLNAGILGEFGDLKDASIEDLQNTMFVNVWSNKLIYDAILGRQIQPRQVVAISSGASVNGNRGWSGYSISKAALNMLVRLLAVENPETHFCALAPGLVDTAMQDDLCGREPDPRFPALAVLRSKRNTSEMPDGDNAAIMLAKTFDGLPKHVGSGEFADIRKLGLQES